MTLCPVALAVSCQKCPVVGFCPLKTVIGDYRQPEEIPPPPASDSTPKK